MAVIIWCPDCDPDADEPLQMDGVTLRQIFEGVVRCPKCNGMLSFVWEVEDEGADHTSSDADD